MTAQTGVTALIEDGDPGDMINELIAVTRRFAETVPAQMTSALDQGDPDAVEACWSGICEIGLDRCLLPDPLGGTGLAGAALMPLLEELAAGDGGVALSTLLSNVALLCLASGWPEAAGERERAAFVPAPALRVVAPGRLSGSSALAVGMTGATRIMVCAGETGAGGLFAIDPGAEGLRCAARPNRLGLRGAPGHRLEFGDVIARPLGDGAAATALLHAGVAAIARGIARRAEQMALAYANERYQGGGPIIGHGAVRDMLARMAERRLAVCSTGTGLASALAARIAATDAAVLTTTDAVQVFGGMGYMVETGVEKLMRDAKACQIYPISNWVAREALLEPQDQTKR